MPPDFSTAMMVAGDEVKPVESGLTPLSHEGKSSMSSLDVKYVELDSEPMVENVTLLAVADMSTSGCTCVRCAATSAGWYFSEE